MESVINKLQRVGLTEYEAKTYLALLNTHLSTATQASEKSGVLLKDKDLMIILPRGEKPTEELKQLAPTATTKARIYVDYKGQEANSGSISFESFLKKGGLAFLLTLFSFPHHCHELVKEVGVVQRPRGCF